MTFTERARAFLAETGAPMLEKPLDLDALRSLANERHARGNGPADEVTPPAIV